MCCSSWTESGNCGKPVVDTWQLSFQCRPLDGECLVAVLSAAVDASLTEDSLAFRLRAWEQLGLSVVCVHGVSMAGEFEAHRAEIGRHVLPSKMRAPAATHATLQDAES